METEPKPPARSALGMTIEDYLLVEEVVHGEHADPELRAWLESVVTFPEVEQ